MMKRTPNPEYGGKPIITCGIIGLFGPVPNPINAGKVVTPIATIGSNFRRFEKMIPIGTRAIRASLPANPPTYAININNSEIKIYNPLS